MRKLSAVHPLHSLVACMFHSNVSLQSFFSKEVGYGRMIRWLILGCWASRGLAVGGLWGSFSSCPYRFHISYILNHSHTIQLIWSCCWISQWWTYCTCKMLYGCTDTQEQDALWCIYLHTIGACCCKMRTCRVALYMKLGPLNWANKIPEYIWISLNTFRRAVLLLFQSVKLISCSPALLLFW